MNIERYVCRETGKRREIQSEKNEIRSGERDIYRYKKNDIQGNRKKNREREKQTNKQTN